MRNGFLTGALCALIGLSCAAPASASTPRSAARAVSLVATVKPGYRATLTVRAACDIRAAADIRSGARALSPTARIAVKRGRSKRVTLAFTSRRSSVVARVRATTPARAQRGCPLRPGATARVSIRLKLSRGPKPPAGGSQPTGGGPTGATPTTPSASGWDKPTLVNPTVKLINAQHTNLALDTTKDYVIQLAPGVDSLPTGVSIWGGHNVVFENAHLNILGASGGMVLKNQTGTMWLSGIHISGPQLMEGIDLDQRQPNATVVLRNILVDTVHGSYTTNHADVLQTWAGPSRLLIDGLTASTEYQGFFLLPRQQWSAGPWPAIFDLRDVNIVDGGGYALWRDSGNPYPLNLQDVYVDPNPLKLARDWWLWPKPSTGDTSWSSVVGNAPPGGDFVVPTASGATARADLQPPAPLPGEQPF